MASTSLKAITSAQPAQEPRSPYEQLKRKLEVSKAEFLPLFGQSQQNVDRFIRVVLNAVLANPELLDADRGTLVSACMKAAQDGLMPDGREAVLNIYNTKVKRGGREEWIKAVQYLPMVGGLVKKLYAGGEVTNVDAAAVYENDRFVWRRGDDPKLEHEPTMADDAGRVVAAYAVVRMKSGEIKREVMPRRDIEAVRAASKAGDSANSPWGKWYDQQAIKSVIKRAYKQLPKSDAFEQIESSDNQALGFAATPQSVADIVTRNAPAPALENNPSETLDMPLQGQPATEIAPADRPDTGAESQDDQQPQREQAQEHPQAGAGGAGTRPVRRRYSTYADRVLKAQDRDAADIVIDEARSDGLPAEQLKDLGKLADGTFPA